MNSMLLTFVKLSFCYSPKYALLKHVVYSIRRNEFLNQLKTQIYIPVHLLSLTLNCD